MEPGARTKLFTATVLAVVFGTGALVGLAGSRYVEARGAEVVAFGDRGEGRDQGPQDSRGERGRRMFVYEQIDPTPQQRVLIDSIMSAQREKMTWLHQDFGEARRVYRENYDGVIQDTRKAIAAVFPAAQAAEYRQKLAEYDRRRAEERARERDRDERR